MKWNEKQLQCLAYLIIPLYYHYFYTHSVSSLMHCISLHEIKNLDTVQTNLLWPRPFTNSHFQFPIIVQLTDSQLLPQQPNQMICCKVWLVSMTVPPLMAHIKNNSCCIFFLFRVSNLMHLFIISLYIPLHVSSHIVLIIRRIYCIYTASGSLCITHLGWLFRLNSHPRRVIHKEPDTVYIQ